MSKRKRRTQGHFEVSEPYQLTPIQLFELQFNFHFKSPASKRKARMQTFKLVREEHGYTQEQMSKKLKISASTYGKYERGDVEPPIKLFYRVYKMAGL